MLLLAAVAAAGYVDDFSTDTSGNYTLEYFEQGAQVAPPTLTWGPATLHAQSAGQVSYKMMLSNGELLDMGEYVEVKVAASAGGLHWRNLGLIVSDHQTPLILNGGPSVGNGFILLFDPAVDNRASMEYHVDGFAAFDSGEGICDMAPTPANVYASGTLVGDTHTLRIKKLATSLEFYVDGGLVYTYNDQPGATVNTVNYVGLHYGDWQGDQAGDYDDFTVTPEPATLCLLGGGMIGLLLRRRT